jgi:hypothetical protein
VFSRTPLPGAAPSTQFEAAYRKQSRNSRSEDARAKLQRFAPGRFFPFTRPGLIGVTSAVITGFRVPFGAMEILLKIKRPITTSNKLENLGIRMAA